MKPLLLHIPYSPWSERARIALAVAGVEYEAETYQPLLGELRLRRLRRGRAGPASVPVLVADGEVVADSTDIARWANRRRTTPVDLFPEAHGAAMTRWVATADRGLSAGRALALGRTLSMPDALDELVPRNLKFLGPVARAIAAAGVRRTLRKYGTAPGLHSPEAYRAGAAAALDELRAGLIGARHPERSLAAGGDDGGVPVLLGQLSYADIAMAQVLTFVTPHTSLRVKANNRAAFLDPQLAASYADLVAWRDALYQRLGVTT